MAHVANDAQPLPCPYPRKKTVEFVTKKGDVVLKESEVQLECPKIVIIGAGIAGIGAANRLMEHGYNDITILEAQERIGGRVHSKQLGKSIIEMGAQWIHGEEGNPVYEIAEANHLVHDEEIPMDALNAEFRSQDGEIFYTHLASDFEIIMRSFSEECRDVSSNQNSGQTSKTDRSVLVFFQRKFTEYVKATSDMPRSAIIKEALFRWYCFFRNIVEGCDSLAEMSVKSWGDYKECSGNQVVNLKNGYRDILDVLSSGIRTDQIILNKPVRAVHIAKPVEGRLPEGKLPVNVLCQDGEAFQCHHAIVTCSLGYLKRFYNSMFLPPVPEAKRQAITQLGYGTVNKMYLEFEKPFWPPDSSGYSLLWLDDPAADVRRGIPAKQTMTDIWFKAIVGFYTVLNQPNFLCGWIAGKEARFMETLDDSAVVDACVKLLKQFTKKDKLPEVVKFIRSSWYSNPYTLGSYSYKTWQCDNLADPVADLAAPMTLMLEDKSVGGYRKHPAIMFAGEATHPSHYSTVHGGLLSGWREADNIASYYRALNEEMEQEILLAETYKDLISMHRVIIIGAGIAGLAAAEKLQEDGITNFKILEARSVPGGRLSSLPYEDKPLELGAQWIHGERGNNMYSFAQQHYLLDLEADENYEAEGLFLTSAGSMVDYEVVKEIKDVCFKALHIYSSLLEKDSKLVPTSIGELLNNHFQKYLDDYHITRDEAKMKTAVFKWFWNFLCIDNSCFSMDEVSTRTWFEYVDCPGNSRVSVKGGFRSIIDKMVHGLSKDSIALNSPVKYVAWDRPPLTLNLIRMFDPTLAPLPKTSSSTPTTRAGRKMVIPRVETEEVVQDVNDDSNENRRILGLRRIIRHPDTYPIQIICENGDMYLCEHLIVTSSLGCLKETAVDMFYPSLTESKQRAIRTMGFGTINKIFLVFEMPFWDEECKGFQFLWLDEDIENAIYEDTGSVTSYRHPWFIDITGFDTMPSHPNVLLGWIGREGAIKMEKLSDEQVIEECMNLLRRFIGKDDIPNPINIVRSAWYSDPYIQGSYSYRTVASDKEDCSYCDLETPIYLQVSDLKYPAILFAGEATHKTHYSTVHGAMSSGYREAGRINDFYAMIREKVMHEHEKLMKLIAASADKSLESVKTLPSIKAKPKEKGGKSKDKKYTT